MTHFRKFHPKLVVGSIALGLSAISGLAIADSGTVNDKQYKEKEAGESIESIVVYGQKIERTMKDTASSLSVIGEEQLRKNSDQSTISEIINGIPNIIYAGSTDAPIIRGTDTKGPVTAGNAYLAKPVPGATISVDGKYLSPAELNLGAAGIWDVSSIEVYRGPQTTSQGANSIAGAIVINTHNPTSTPELAVQALYGSRNKKRLSFMASGALSDDFSARVSADYSSRDTYVDYVNSEFTAHDFDFGFMNKNLRAKLLWEPEQYSNFSAMFTYSMTEAERPSNEVVSEPYDDLENHSVYQDNQTVNNDVGILDLEYLFDNGVKLHNKLQYSEGDYDFFFAAPYQGIAERNNNNLSNELRLNVGDQYSIFSGVVGIFYSQDKSNNKLNNTLGNADADIQHDSFAPFGEIIWRFSSQWQLTGALRYQVDNISHEGMNSYVPDVFQQYDEEFTALLPKATLSHDVSENVVVGAMIGKGYIPGGTGVNFRGGEYYTFDAEYAWNYEVFARINLLEKRLIINSNIFYTSLSDSQRSVTDYLDGRAFGSVIINADEAKSYGLELDFNFKVTDNFGLNGGLGLLETEVSEFNDYRGEQFVGTEFSKAPGYMFNIGFDYAITDKFKMNAGARHTDGYFSSDTNEVNLRVDSYTTVNLNSSYQINQHIEAFAYVRNLLDDRAPLAKMSDRGTGGVNAYLLEPREIGLGVRAKF
ncbi:MAG: TonB-dependent receptor [Paraglaciecola sp.]|uniref:TonB-dependent receptor n=1 Tax=Paraglaciecola sp. TaxID=1920173 RepID=UPI003299D96A